jgi:hypothetical protein
MGIHRRRKLLLATMSLAILVALPGVAQAHQEAEKQESTPETPPPPPVTEVTSVLPVLGSGLTVSLTRDEAGNLTQVALDPSGATIVKEGDHKVVFLLADGDTQVVVKSYSKEKGDEERAGGVKTTVTADATADVTGDGSWSADVFGTGVVTIPYTVSWDGNNPTITIGEIVLPAGVTAEVGEPRIKMSDEKSKFKISVKLSNGEDDARVNFHASARFDDDDDDGDESELKVKLAITLDAKDHRDCDDRHDRGDRDDDDRNRGDDDDDEVAGASVSSGDRWDDDDDGRDHDRDHDDDDGDHDRDHDDDDGDHDRGGDDD